MAFSKTLWTKGRSCLFSENRRRTGLKRFCGYDESWGTELVGLFCGCEAMAGEQMGHLGREPAVTFEEQTATRSESCGGEPSYGSIEQERVVVGDKQGRVWLILKYIGLDLCLLACADVGGIAHYYVEARCGRWRHG